MIYLLSFIAFWLACGFVAAGLMYGWACSLIAPARTDRAFMWLITFFGGPIALSLAYAHGDYRHGWRKWW